MDNLSSFDAEKFYLGGLCRRKHDFQQTGKSLRYRSSLGCLECYKTESAKQRKSKYNRSEKGKAAQKRFRESLKGKLYIKSWIEQNLEKMREYQRESKRRQRETPEGRERSRLANKKFRSKPGHSQRHHQLYKKKYLKTAKGKLYILRQTSKKRYRKLVSRNTVLIERLEQRFEAFGGCCAYCGSDVDLTVDHFLPLSKDGPDCIGNYIPACRKCNTSKSDTDPKDWYQSRPFYSLKRWKKILQVLGVTDRDYNQIPLF